MQSVSVTVDTMHAPLRSMHMFHFTPPMFFLMPSRRSMAQPEPTTPSQFFLSLAERCYSCRVHFQGAGRRVEPGAMSRCPGPSPNLWISHRAHAVSPRNAVPPLFTCTITSARACNRSLPPLLQRLHVLLCYPASSSR